MAEDRAAVDGSYLSALPDKPPRWNTTIPEALSASEGSGQGVPACSNAVPEAQPLTGELRDDPTTSSISRLQLDRCRQRRLLRSTVEQPRQGVTASSFAVSGQSSETA